MLKKNPRNQSDRVRKRGRNPAGDKITTASKSKRELRKEVARLRRQLKNYEELLRKAAIRAEEVLVAAEHAQDLKHSIKSSLTKEKTD